MNAPAACRFPVPPLEQLEDDVRARIEEVKAKSGFVPNVFLALARRPAEFRAFFAYHDALMERDGGLTRAEREMIVVATSASNSCAYCVVAHGAILRIRAKDPLIADQLAINHNHAPLGKRQRAIVDFALKVANRAPEVTESDYEALRQVGLDEEDIWDVVAITALFALSNRMASGVGIQPNAEFYTLGRDLPLPEHPGGRLG
ncbi:MAG: peroxidase-related enzyme [Actinobacteria bacterium]|nr:peroxidase-related enzyme [Actinomycetota bacterium]